MATPFKPRDNPAFILHGKLKTSYEQVTRPLAWLTYSSRCPRWAPTRS